MRGSAVTMGRLARTVMAAGLVTLAFAGRASSADDVADTLAVPADVPSARGIARSIDLNVTLYRASLTAGERLIYDEIFDHFADAVFEATEGQHIIDDVNVFLDGQPSFDPIPIITVLGANPSYVEAGTAYVDAGATAMDVPDGSVVVTSVGSVNTSVEGAYPITYFATDSSGQTATATRTVFVRGRAPVILLLGQEPVYHTQNTVYFDAGAVALDLTDGNLTDEIIAFTDLDDETVGEYFVDYEVTDSSGRTTVAFRTVNVVAANFDEPRISLNPPNPVTINVGDTYVEPGASAVDLTDGPVPVFFIPSVDTSIEGTYFVQYFAFDAAANESTAIRQVNVIGRDPVLSLPGSNPVTIEAGPTYIDAGASAIDISDGNLTPNIQRSLNVDTTKAGTGSVTYFVTDSAGNTTIAVRTVHVVESSNRGHAANVYWSEQGVPGFRSSGGFGTDGGQILMADVFPGGEAGADINFLATAEDRRRAGYIMAALWLQYALGLGPEFNETGGDIAVAGSILADPYSPAFAGSGLGLNMSSTQDGVATGGVFQTLESTNATTQFRLQGASAWATAARTYGEDPKPPRLIAKRPRTAFPELTNNAPVGNAAPVTNLGAIPTGALGPASYFDNRRSWFRLATENTLSLVAGERIRTATTCRPGRLIDVRTPNPVVFEFPADASMQEILVSVRTPCDHTRIQNLDALLVDPTGRIVEPTVFLNSGAIEFRRTPSVPGTWRLTLFPRNLSVIGVQVDVLGQSFGETPRISTELVNAPSPTAWTNTIKSVPVATTIVYPNPFVVTVSNAAGRAIRGMTVTALLTNPSGTERTIEFKDDGASPDLIASDGVYSAVIQYIQQGAHQLEVTMSDLTGTAQYTLTGVSLAPTQGFTAIENTVRPPDQMVGDRFMRSAFTTFQVTGLRPDDHGDTFLEATNLPYTNADRSARFDRPGDVDYFSVDVIARGATADTIFRATHWSGTGQLQLRLLDASGTTEIARGTTSPSRYPMIRQDLASGRYYLEVSGVNVSIGDTYSVSVGAPVPSDLASIGIGVNVGAPTGGGGGGGGGCFIATAAYGTPLYAEIDALRGARDGFLLTNATGAAFSDVYYRVSPPIAEWVAQNGAARAMVRGMIYAILHPVWMFVALAGVASMAALVSRRRTVALQRVKR